MENLTNMTVDVNMTSTSAFQEIGKYLWAVISPILMLIGLVGNTISFLVLFKLFRSKKTTFHLFLSVLSLNDLVVLFSGLLRYWIIYTFDFDVRDQSNASCKIQLYVIYTTMQYSAWILVSVSLQRCIIVACPNRFSQMYTLKAASIQLVLIFSILSAINFHFFFTNGIKDGSCESLTDGFYNFEEYFFVWIDLFVLCLIPFFSMLVSNIYLKIHVHKYSAAVNKSDDAINKRINHSIRITLRLTWLFLATTLPISVFFIFDSYYKDDKSSFKDLLKAICYLIQYAGFSFNICLYVSVDRKFVSVLRTQARKIESSFKSKTSFQLNRRPTLSSFRTTDSARETTHTQTQVVTVLD